MKREVIVNIIALTIFLVLLHIGISKLFNLHRYRVEIFFSPQLRPFRATLSILIPIVELITGLLIIAKRTRIIGFYVALTLFSLYIAGMFTLSYYVPNPRGGIFNHSSYNELLTCNIILFSLSLTGILLKTYKRNSSLILTRKEPV
jgi:uncharacterized membrane protein YphA (DoxX/SURF4 family)